MHTNLIQYADQIGTTDLELAIRVARMADLVICKHADPTEGAREGLSVDEAIDIAREDVSLVYVIVAGGGQ